MGRILCIHGAWQGSWSWQRLVPLLEEAGFDVDAVDLPGNGSDDVPLGSVTLDLYVQHLRSRIHSAAGMHWLLAHSGAGVIASQLAEALPQRIAGIIYVAGIMLPSDVRFAELVAEYMTVDRTASGIGPFLEWSKDLTVSRVPESAARHIFFHDVDPTTADWAVRRLTPQPEGGRAVRPSLSAARFGSVRRIYIETIADRSVVHGLQRHMQQVVPGAERLSLNTGHFPQLVAPRQLAEMIRSQIHRNPDGC